MLPTSQSLEPAKPPLHHVRDPNSGLALAALKQALVCSLCPFLPISTLSETKRKQEDTDFMTPQSLLSPTLSSPGEAADVQG